MLIQAIRTKRIKAEKNVLSLNWVNLDKNWWSQNLPGKFAQLLWCNWFCVIQIQNFTQISTNMPFRPIKIYVKIIDSSANKIYFILTLLDNPAKIKFV